MAVSLDHLSLRTTLLGLAADTTAQFRGIPYGNIPKRFAEPKPVTSLPDELDCSRYGFVSPIFILLGPVLIDQ